MNTDNMSIAGETIDYGPCAFMDFYHPKTVYSSIDHQGRYAYGNQPRIAQWNLSVLAQSLLPLLGADEEASINEAQAAIDRFPSLYKQTYEAGLRAKLGLAREQPGDIELAEDLLDIMAKNEGRFHPDLPPVDVMPAFGRPLIQTRKSASCSRTQSAFDELGHPVAQTAGRRRLSRMMRARRRCAWLIPPSSREIIWLKTRSRRRP